MVLIVGGKSQGKSKFAVDNFPQMKLVDNLQDVIREKMDKAEVLEEIEDNAVVVCDEVGCGIVPVERQDREYRELVGEICCELAKRADKVYRVICGMGVVIKDVDN